MKCPKCEGEMEEGYIPEITRYQEKNQVWKKGSKRPIIQKVVDAESELDQEERVIRTYRCKNCGYLESYAK